MRFDANVSIRPRGDQVLGTRAEVKNMNSLRSLQRAVAHEIDRQIGVVESGGAVVQETRHWNEGSGTTSSMRSKEESEDYRYFQEPDLVPLEVDAAWQRRVVDSLPELPAVRRTRYRDAGIDEATVSSLVDDDALGRYFDAATEAGADPKTAGNWLTGEVVAYLRQEQVELTETGLAPEDLVALGDMVTEGIVSASAAKDVLRGVLAGEGRPAEVADARDLVQISDDSLLEAELDAVLAAHPDELVRLREGDMKPVGFLVGQVMRATGGKADPRKVSALLRQRIAG